jgi:hypothetical protein
VRPCNLFPRLSLGLSLCLSLVLAACSQEPTVAPERPVGGPVLAIGVDSVSGASIETNKDDFVPGEIVHLVLKGWKPGEDVRLVMSESPSTHVNVDTTVTVDVDGEWSGHFYDVQEHDAGVAFTLTATGLESGSSATVLFTDSVSLSIFSLNPSPPTVGNSFIVTMRNTLATAGSPDNWFQTRFRLTRTGYSGNIYDSCRNNPNHTPGDGHTNPHQEAFTIPASGGDWDAGQSLEPGDYTLLVRGFAEDGDCDTGDDTPYPASDLTTTFTVLPSAGPYLVITKVANSDPVCDTGGGDPDFCLTREATFTLTVTNNGLSATSGTVTVTDTLPATTSGTDYKLNYVNSTGGGWTCGSITLGASPFRDVVTCTTSDVIAGSGGTKVLTLKVDPEGDGENTDETNLAWVEGGGDATPASGSEVVDIREPPEVIIDSIVVTPNPVAANGAATAKVWVSLSGSGDWSCMIGRVRNADGSSNGLFSDIQTNFEPDHTTPGEYNQSFGFTAPATNGTWGLRVRVYSDDSCDDDEVEGFVTFVVGAPATAPTTTAVAGSPNPSVNGESVTFTATVTVTAGGAPVITGTVNFMTGGTDCTNGAPFALNATLNGSGQATGSRSFSVAESGATIRACYSGAAGFNPSNGTTTQSVNMANTTTSLSDAPTSSNVGQTVVFTATVAPVAPGAGTPTGTINLYEFTGGQSCTALGGASAIGTGSLSSGTVDINVSTLGAGNHTVTACYGGDTGFSGSNGTDTHTVSLIATTTSITSLNNPSVTGQTTTFTASVKDPGNLSVTTGSVTFKSGGTSCTDVAATAFSGPTAVNGSGQVTTAAIAYNASQSPLTIWACYAGTAAYTASEGSVAQTINKAGTTTTLDAAPNPSTFGQQVTFTATVAAVLPGVGTPTGNVTFHEFAAGGTCAAPNGTLHSTQALAAGVASFNLSSLGAGAHSITACYGGDTNFGISEDTESQTVNQAGTTTSLASSANPSVFSQSVTLTATVAVVAPGAGTPTGSVAFRELAAGGTCAAPNGTLHATVALAAGQASHATSALAVGGHAITVCYLGSANFLASEDVLTQTVNRAPTTTSLASDLNPSDFSDLVTFTATVAAPSPATATPGGDVKFYEFAAGGTCAAPNGTLHSTQTLAAGQAAFSINSLVAGSHVITACYQGTTSFVESDDALTQVVDPATTTTVASIETTTPQYSDEVTLRATVTPHILLTSELTGTVHFYFGAAAVTCGTSAPAGAVGSDAIAAADDGVAEIDYVIPSQAAGYTVTTCFYSTNSNFGHSGDAESITVGKEDAEGTTIANVGAAQVGATSFAVTIGIKEARLGNGNEPDQNAGQFAGNINNVPSLTAVASPENGSGNISATCVAGSVQGSGYGAVKSFTCTFNNGATPIPVDVYTLTFTVGGNYYTGTYEDVFSIWDPNAGFATGGGSFLLSGNRVSFGFSFTMTKGKTSVRGGLVAIMHLPGGGVCRVKSNSMNAPSVSGNVATLGGKGNYNCVVGGITTISQGNINVIAVAEDWGTSGIGVDKFRVRAMDQLNMTALELLTGGNVQVPQPGNK